MLDAFRPNLPTIAAVIIGALTAGCGVSGPTGPAHDAAAQVFACGTDACRATEVCVHPACGCVEIVHSPDDAGACADGTAFAQPFDGCVPDCQPEYCETPGPADPYTCTGDHGSFAGTIDGVPDAAGVACYEGCL